MKKFKNFQIRELKIGSIKGGYSDDDAEGYQFDTCEGYNTWCGYGVGYRADEEKDGTWVSSC